MTEEQKNEKPKVEVVDVKKETKEKPKEDMFMGFDAESKSFEDVIGLDFGLKEKKKKEE